MAQQYINIGSLPADGTGDPIRVSFDKINQNFAEIYSNVTELATTASGGVNLVTSVSGKTGAIQLTTADVLGAVTQGYVDNKIEQKLSLLVSGAPDALNTLKELADAINSDPTFYQNLNSKLPISGGTLTGQLTLVSDPVSPLQPTTKRYVDNLVSTLTNSDVYTKSEIDQLLLNMKNDWGFINDAIWGLITDPATIFEDYGSL